MPPAKAFPKENRRPLFFDPDNQFERALPRSPAKNMAKKAIILKVRTGTDFLLFSVAMP